MKMDEAIKAWKDTMDQMILDDAWYDVLEEYGANKITWHSEEGGDHDEVIVVPDDNGFMSLDAGDVFDEVYNTMVNADMDDVAKYIREHRADAFALVADICDNIACNLNERAYNRAY